MSIPNTVGVTVDNNTAEVKITVFGQVDTYAKVGPRQARPDRPQPPRGCRRDG